MDPSIAASLDAHAAALGLLLDDAQRQRLLAYLSLLQRWNAVYNLTALRDPAQMLSHHLVDCLAVVPALRRKVDEAVPVRLLDVGSGGGLPGVVLAVTSPSWDVTCVDTVGKKAAFVQQVAGELDLPNLHAVHRRVEQMSGEFDVVMSRAFATLADFTAWTEPRLAAGGVWMAMKGKQPDGEIAALAPGVEVFHVEHLRVPGLEAERCLVWMRRRATPAPAFPGQ